LLQVDDVDAVARREDVRAHLGVPPAGLVTEVNPGLEQLAEGGDGHVAVPPGWVGASARRRSAVISPAEPDTRSPPSTGRAEYEEGKFTSPRRRQKARQSRARRGVAPEGGCAARRSRVAQPHPPFGSPPQRAARVVPPSRRAPRAVKTGAKREV